MSQGVISTLARVTQRWRVEMTNDSVSTEPNDGKKAETPIGVVLATLDKALLAIGALPGLSSPLSLPHNLHVAVRAASDVRSLLESGGEDYMGEVDYDPINVKAALDVLASGVQDADMQREIRVLRSELGIEAAAPSDAEVPCHGGAKPVDDSSRATTFKLSDFAMLVGDNYGCGREPSPLVFAMNALDDLKRTLCLMTAALQGDGDVTDVATNAYFRAEASLAVLSKFWKVEIRAGKETSTNGS